MDPLCVCREPGMGKGEEASLIRTSTPGRPAMASTPNRTRPHHQPSQDRETRMQRGAVSQCDRQRSPMLSCASVRRTHGFPGLRLPWRPGNGPRAGPHHSTAALQRSREFVTGFLRHSRECSGEFLAKAHTHTHTHTHTLGPSCGGKPAMKQPALASLSR